MSWRARLGLWGAHVIQKKIFAITIAFVAASTVRAQSAGDGLAREVALSSGKFGITVVRGVLQSQPGARYISPPESGAAGATIDAVVASYGNQKARMQGEITIVAGAVDGLADSAAAGTLYRSGGAGAIPVAMVRSAVQAGTDDYFASAREKANETMRAFLAKNQAKIIADAKLSYEELQTRSPAEIRDLLDKGTRTFKDLDGRVTDPEVRALAKDLVVSSIINTQKATLDQLTSQGAVIVDIRGRLGTLEKAHQKLADLTVTALDQQQRSITALQGAVGDLDAAVGRVENRLAAQERNLDFVQDFVFDQMPAAQKAAALKSGFMAARFACADGGQACDEAKLKGELISRFDAEAHLQSTIQSAGDVLQTANGVLKIASDLGIDTGPAADVVKYGTVAFNTFASFASGNYIGAIASITGAFGKSGPDPQIEFLKQQFALVNKKLDLVLENQRQLSEQIAKLSERLDQHVAQLNGRFDTVEARIERVRNMQAASFNSEWQSCQQVYLDAIGLQNQPIFSYDHSLASFGSVEQAHAFGLSYARNVDACIDVVSARPNSIALANWFGNFLNADFSLDTPDKDLDIIAKDRANAWYLVQDYAQRHSVSLWQIYRMLAAPAEVISSLRARLATPTSPDNPCDAVSGALAKDRLRVLLCESTPGSQPDPSLAAANGLNISMLPQRAIAVAGWILVEQALVDVRALPSTGRPVTALDLIRYNPGGAPRTQGEEHTERAMLTLDAAMANLSMLHGDVTVEAILDALTSAHEADATREEPRQRRLAAARSLLAAHPYLARNVANALLNDRRGIYVGGSRTDAKPAESAYRSALRFAEESTSGDPNALFSTLFGPGLGFERIDTKRIVLELLAADGNNPRVVAPMPEPLAFASGRLFYPEEARMIERTREQVGAKLLDYRAFRDLSGAQRLTITKTLARAELSKAR